MSRQFDRLKETIENFYPEYKSWVEENSAYFPHDKIWTGVFTPQEISALLLEFVETIKIVLEDKEQCLKYVSESELQAIGVDLNNMLQVAKQKDYNRFAEIMEIFIPRMRPFQFLSMEKMNEKRAHEISEIDKNLSEIKRLQKSVTSTVNKAKSDSEDLCNLIESATEKNKKFDELFNERNNELNELFNEKNIKLDELINENNQKIKSLETTHTNANDYAIRLNNYVGQVDNILNGANEQKSKIDSFVNLIQEREEKIISQNVAIEAYEEKLESFSVEQQTKLKDFSEKCQSIMEKAEDLIEKSRQALSLSTATGLSGAFQVRRKKLEKWWVKLAWLWGGGVSAISAVGVGVVIIFFDKDLTILSIVARFLIMMILIMIAVFCARQYGKNRSYEEDYAYKVALAASIPGLSVEFEKAGVHKEYIGKLLDEILQDPQRTRHDKESLIDSYPVMAELKNLLKSITNKKDKP